MLLAVQLKDMINYPVPAAKVCYIYLLLLLFQVFDILSQARHISKFYFRSWKP